MGGRRLASGGVLRPPSSVLRPPSSVLFCIVLFEDEPCRVSAVWHIIFLSLDINNFANIFDIKKELLPLRR